MSKPTYPETLDYLFSQLPMYQRIGSAAYKADLNNTIALCQAAGNPHQKLKCIHVAGTNGKGSVSHIIASVLQEQGYKVGLYTSPHYKDFRERIKINGTYIPEYAVVDFVAKYKTVFETIQPSFFEMTVLMAFEYFVQQQVDYAVIEVGLGGRLDSTNVITPLLSVITNISFDHTDLLGNTLEKIAAEKAGIIKNGVPVIIGETHPETKNVFINKARQCHAPIIFADAEQLPVSSQFNNNYHCITIGSRQVETDLYGNYQTLNIRTALAALDYINQHQLIPLTPHALLNGLKNVKTNTRFTGRFQVVSKQPLVILDSAHNPSGLTLLLQQILGFRFNRLHVVYGTVADKDLSKVLPLLPAHATYYFCKANIPRGLDANLLQTQAQTFNLQGKAYATVRHAYEAALWQAGENDLVLVAGSIFVVAEVI